MRRPPAWIEFLASLELTLISLALMMLLLIVGTLAQVDLGTFAAQKKFFNSFLICIDLNGMKFPIFPGGMSIGLLWLVNLIAAFVVRFRWERKTLGIFISHAGLILLVAGQGLTQLLARESNLALQIGESRNYSESLQDTELVVINTTPADYDEVTSIPYKHFSHEGLIEIPRLPFTLNVRRFYPNALLSMAGSIATSGATQGVGTRIMAQPDAPVSSDEESNNVTALIEVLEGSRSLGVWLVSSGLGAPQSFTVKGNTYQLFIRLRRIYFPFTITLKEFRHDIYPGTDIPKNFSSFIHLSNPETHERRDALIYMNHPLRYQGRTFYQASFGEGDKLSVLQVVENPASVTPYVACLVVLLGLAIQFLSHLLGFLRNRA